MASLPKFDFATKNQGPPPRGRLSAVPCFDIEAAVARIAAGGIVILAEGCSADAAISLIAAADDIAEATVNMMARDAHGLICLAVTAEQADRIGLEPMVASPRNTRCVGFARSIEATTGVTTGISAADRARTMVVAADPDASPQDLVSPGHVFPIIAHARGLVGRLGATEAALALIGLAGCRSASLCRILRADGEAATLADLPGLAWASALPPVTVAMLLEAQCAVERLVEREGEPRSVGQASDLRMIAYRSVDGGHRHIALVRGSAAERRPATVQICRRAPDGQDIEAESALAAAISHAIGAPSDNTLLLIDAGDANDPTGHSIVVKAITRQILDDIADHG